MAHDVYVSHSPKDRTPAYALVAGLEKLGVRCWIPPRDIPLNADWGEACIEAIKGSKAMVLVFTSTANASRDVAREVAIAGDAGLPIITFRLEDIPPSGSLEPRLAPEHWLNAVQAPVEQHLGTLADTLFRVAAITPSAPVVDEKPAPAPEAAPLVMSAAAVEQNAPAPRVPTLTVVAPQPAPPIRQDPRASIRIVTNPPGASVMVNRVPQGGPTPSTLTYDLGDLASRAIEVTLSAPGYRQVVFQVELKRGEQTPVQITLQRVAAPPPGSPYPTQPMPPVAYPNQPAPMPGHPTVPPPPGVMVQGGYPQPMGYGPPMYQQPVGPRPNIPNYLAWSIINTVCCCLILGAIAIAKSAEVNTKLNCGDYLGAQRASDSARALNLWATIGGGVITVIYLIIVISNS